MQFDPKLAAQEYFSKHAAECELVSCTATNSPNYYFFHSLAVPAVILFALYCAHRFGWPINLRNFLERRIKWPVARPSLFAICLSAYLWLAVFPVLAYQRVILGLNTGSHVIIRSNDVATQSFLERFWSWLGHYAIDGLGWVIAAAILLPIAILIIRLLPRFYWAIAALGFSAFVTSSYIDVPYEGRYELPDSALKRDIAVMAEAANAPMERVHIGNQKRFFGTKLDAHANWVGGGQRVIIGEYFFNTLPLPPAIISPSFEPITAAEVRAVAGHELAHIRHNHVYWLNGLGVLLTFTLAWLANLIVKRSIRRNSDMRALGDVSAIPILVIAFGLAVFAMTVLQVNAHRIAENQADATGLDIARDPDGFAQLAVRENRKRPLKRRYFVQSLVTTHPDGVTRIQRAMEWKAANTPGDWESEGLSGPIRVRCAGNRMVLLNDSDLTRRNVCTIENEWDNEDLES